FGASTAWSEWHPMHPFILKSCSPLAYSGSWLLGVAESALAWGPWAGTLGPCTVPPALAVLTESPLGAAAAGLGPRVRMWAAQASYSAGLEALTWNAIRACWIPQNSAHWPGKSPAESALNHIRVCRPGNTSRFPANRGGQKLWTTSAEFCSSSTVLPTGTCSSLAVVTLASG